MSVFAKAFVYIVLDVLLSKMHKIGDWKRISKDRALDFRTNVFV